MQYWNDLSVMKYTQELIGISSYYLFAWRIKHAKFSVFTKNSLVGEEYIFTAQKYEVNQSHQCLIFETTMQP